MMLMIDRVGVHDEMEREERDKGGGWRNLLLLLPSLSLAPSLSLLADRFLGVESRATWYLLK